jgi:hypothetical protein
MATAGGIERHRAQPDEGEVGIGIDDEASSGKPLGLALFAYGIALLGKKVTPETRQRKEEA